MISINVNCMIGDKVYKICPKCNDRHNGSCKNCAWEGCIWSYCNIEPKIYKDGSFTKSPLQVVQKVVNERNFAHINEEWNIAYFESEQAAQKAIQEYDAISNIENCEERVKSFNEWYQRRKTDVNIERCNDEENKN